MVGGCFEERRQWTSVVELDASVWGCHRLPRCKMTLAELLPVLHALPRADKVRAVQFLTSELAQQESQRVLTDGAEYPVWSPFDAHDAATTLADFLKGQTGRS